MTNEEIQVVVDQIAAAKKAALKAKLSTAYHYVATHSVAMAIGGAAVFALTKLL